MDHEKDEILIVLIPHIVRLPSITAENLRSIASGTDTNAEVRLEDAVLLPEPRSRRPLRRRRRRSRRRRPARRLHAPMPASQNATLRFEPGTAALKPGETTTIGLTVQNVQDLYSIPMLLQFNPAVISIEDVRQGGFLSGGTQEVAIVERVDKERGQAIISATRMPNTPGVSGSGTLVGIVVKGIAAGKFAAFDRAGERKGFPAAADPGGHRRRYCSSSIRRGQCTCVDPFQFRQQNLEALAGAARRG